MSAAIFQDWKANAANPKGRLIMVLFRTAYWLRHGPAILWPVRVVYGVFYRIGVEWLLGIELPWKTRVGPGLRIDHGQSLVIHDGTVLGRDCWLRHCTTLGVKISRDGTLSGAPTLGDRVSVGAHSVILGPIHIGDDAVVGSGAVVVKDVPAGAVVAGNPAQIIRSAQEQATTQELPPAG
ncbi:MAG TPA: DapH/DapD/GlmU-related protein [Chthoniobacter sp.]|nr:DapH/DapD/GlmU-related protein [Chthoniobacter sp.]